MIRSDQAWRETARRPETIPSPRLTSNVRRKAAKRGSRSFCVSLRENRNRSDLRADCLRFRRFRTCRGPCNLVTSVAYDNNNSNNNRNKRDEEKEREREVDMDIVEASPALWYCSCFFILPLVFFLFFFCLSTKCSIRAWEIANTIGRDVSM